MLLDMIRQMLARRAAKQGDAPIDRGNQHKRFRFYLFRPRSERLRRVASSLITLLLCGVFLFSAGKLLSYGRDYVSAGQAS